MTGNASLRNRLVSLLLLPLLLLSGLPKDAFALPSTEGDAHTHVTNSASNPVFARGDPSTEAWGLYYLRARYLNAASGRFWTMDSYEGRGTDPASLHKYLYANADPLSGKDPSGHLTLTEAVSVSVVVGTVSGIVSGTISKYTGGTVWGGFLEGFINGSVGTFLTLTAPGLSPYTIGLTSQVAAALISGMVTGEIQSNPNAFTIKLAASIAVGAGFQGPLFRAGLGDSLDQLAANIAAEGIAKASNAILAESGKVITTGLVTGVVSRIPALLVDAVTLLQEWVKSSNEDRAKEFEKLLREE